MRISEHSATSIGVYLQQEIVCNLSHNYSIVALKPYSVDNISVKKTASSAYFEIF